MKIKLVTALAISLIASAAHAQLVGQTVSGSDDGRHSRVLLTDSSGRLNVIGSAAGGVVYGPDAPNGAGTQSPMRIGGSSSPTSNGGTVYNLVLDSSGRPTVNINTGQVIAATQSGTWNDIVTGNIAAGSADSGNPVKGGAVYNSTLPTYTTGQRTDLQSDSRGALSVYIKTQNGTVGAGVVNPSDTLAAQAGLSVIGEGALYNNSTWERVRSLLGVDGTGLGVTAVSTVPNSSANQAITPVVSSALESGHVLKASAGNLYRVRATVTVAGYLMVFNSTTVPADGAVTPLSCTQVGAGTSEMDHAMIPDRYSTGISVAFSTTGCFTKTASVSAMFEGYVQ